MNVIAQQNRCLRVLHLEDDPFDAELISESLREHHLDCSITQVHSRRAFEDALQMGEVDLILSDSKLPGFDTLSAVGLARERLPEIPFIFVSGTMSPKTKADALDRGAADFISKDNLEKLARVIHWLFFLNKRMHRRPALPEIGVPVMVQCGEFRCLGFLDRQGIWRDYGNSSELSNVIDWFDL